MEKEDLKIKIANLNHDVSSLIASINHARKTGKFDVINRLILNFFYMNIYV
jgi:hypothetical protein